MRHEQQDPAVRSRLPLLLPLLLLSLAAPTLIDYYEQQQAYQWEQLLRHAWQPPLQPLTLPPAPGGPLTASAADDVAEPGTGWIAVEPTAAAVAPAVTSSVATPPAATTAPPATPAPTTAPAPARPKAKVTATSGATASRPARTSPTTLKLKLPESAYQGEPAVWDVPAPLPDLFASKPADSQRVQLGGRLITDDDVKKKNPDADFIDTLKGAEINISVKTP